MRLRVSVLAALIAVTAGTSLGCGMTRKAPDAATVGEAGRYINPQGQGMGKSGNPLPQTQGGAGGAPAGVPGLGGGGAQGQGGMGGMGGPPAGVPGLGR